MTAAAAKAKGKAASGKLRGRMPTKRSINLVLVDKNRVKATQAVPAVLAILVLAAVFSKFLVIDRLASVSAAQGRVARLQADLNRAQAALDGIGDVGQTYAHYTLADMTAAELGLVDRTQVLELVGGILPPPIPVPTGARLEAELRSLFSPAPIGNSRHDQARAENRLDVFMQTIPIPEYTINSWTVSENLLTLDISGQTLERLNQLGREIEQSPIVNSCSITNANKDIRRNTQDVRWWNVDEVRARFLVYLQKAAPGAEEEAEQP